MRSLPVILGVLLIPAGCDRSLTESQHSVAPAGTPLVDMPVYKPQAVRLAKDRIPEGTMTAVLQAQPDEFGNIEVRRNEQRIVGLISRLQSPGLDYPGETSLADVFSFIESWLTAEAGCIVPIRLDPGDPDIGSDSYYLENTRIKNLNIAERSMTLRSALMMILEQVEDQELTWIVRNESLLITTVATMESEENLLLRSYDLTDLKSLRLSNQAICLSVMELSSPPTLWIQNGDDIGTMIIAGSHLLVRQTRTGHENVIEVLERMKLAARASPGAR